MDPTMMKRALNRVKGQKPPEPGSDEEVPSPEAEAEAADEMENDIHNAADEGDADEVDRLVKAYELGKAKSRNFNARREARKLLER